MTKVIMHSLSTRDGLVLIEAEYGELLAHARAAVAADRAGETDPLGYIRDVLAERGQLPPAGARPTQLLAVPLGQDLPSHSRDTAMRQE